MGINGWIRWFERLAAGDRRARRQLIGYLWFIGLAAAVGMIGKALG